MTEDATPELRSFPIDVSQFHSDERISFSKLDSKYIAVQEDGTEFEFDLSRTRWVPLAEYEDASTTQLVGYNIDPRSNQQIGSGSKGTKQGQKRKQDQASNHEPHQNASGNKNKGNQLHADNGNLPSGSSNKRARPGQTASKPRHNTAVYVTGLPQDATVDEVAELFSRKCGVIAEEIDSGRPRIRLYTDTDGRFKGDALIVFFKPQSVDMAIMLLDDTDFRFPPPPGTATSGPRMHVQAADASYKKTNYSSNENTGGNTTPSKPTAKEASSSGASDAKEQTKTRDGKSTGDGAESGGVTYQDKQKIIKKTQKLDAKLADWSSDEEQQKRYGGVDNRRNVANPKWDKVVMLKHMFTLQELEEDPVALLDIKEDIREECSKLGEVTNVVLFDLEPQGVVSVKFKTASAARACVNLMHGRAFGGQAVEASLSTGREKYKKSNKKDGDDYEQDDDSDMGV